MDYRSTIPQICGTTSTKYIAAFAVAIFFRKKYIPYNGKESNYMEVTQWKKY